MTEIELGLRLVPDGIGAIRDAGLGGRVRIPPARRKARGGAAARAAPVIPVQLGVRLDLPEGDARCEIRVRGPREGVLDLLRRLDGMTPLRLAVTPGGEPGSDGAFRAEAPDLEAGMAARQGLRLILRAGIRHFRLNEEVLLAGYAPEALHQCRVALRRLRSALAIFRPVWDGKGRAWLSGELRWLASELAEARDLDVLSERLQDAALRTRLAPLQGAARARAMAALASRRARFLMLEVEACLQDNEQAPAAQGAPERSLRSLARKALRRYRRKVRRGGRDLARVSDEARHDLRKDAKKLRYATEFFAPLFDRKPARKRARRFGAALEDLQDMLGALNDRAGAPGLLRRLGLEGDPDLARLLGGQDGRNLMAKAEKAHRRLRRAGKFWKA